MKYLSIVLVVLTLGFAPHAFSKKIYISVGKAHIKRSLVAVPPLQFFGSSSINKGYRRIKQELYSTIFNDLEVSSYFQFVKKSAFIENTNETGLKPKMADKERGFEFENWSSIQTEFLIKAGFRLEAGDIEMTAYVYHVPSRSLIFGKRYKNSKKYLRKIAHRFANDVLEKLTGKRGMFESRIVVSSDRAGGRNKEIFILDWDGKNIKQITKHRSISISPTWSNDNKKIAYTSFAWHPKRKSRNADLFLHDLKSGKKTLVSSVRGINSGAAFLPNTKDLLLTISKNGIPNIFRITQLGKIVERYTTGPRRSMNVEPALSADGKHVAFSSDRSGRPMIYTMEVKKRYSKKLKRMARLPKRIVYAGWYNASPSWSPDGKNIAFAGMDKFVPGRSHFDIFLMKNTGHDLIRLTTSKKFKNGKSSNNEDPTFSPDGRHVMFVSDRTGTKQLYIVNADGSGERRITFDKVNYYKPKWSTNVE